MNTRTEPEEELLSAADGFAIILKGNRVYGRRVLLAATGIHDVRVAEINPDRECAGRTDAEIFLTGLYSGRGL